MGELVFWQMLCLILSVLVVGLELERRRLKEKKGEEKMTYRIFDIRNEQEELEMFLNDEHNLITSIRTESDFQKGMRAHIKAEYIAVPRDLRFTRHIEAFRMIKGRCRVFEELKTDKDIRVLSVKTLYEPPFISDDPDAEEAEARNWLLVDYEKRNW